MKVLQGEDEIDVGKVILSMLEQVEMDAVLVQSHREALEFLDESTVDLLITDLVMPEKSGIDLVKAVRREKRHKKIPVLMISGKAEKEHILQASRVGVNGFIAKPFDPKGLTAKVREVLGQRDE